MRLGLAFASLVLVLAWVGGCGGGACLTEVPEGSYLVTCEDCEMRGTTLSCKCHSPCCAAPLETELETCSCEEGQVVWNNEGNLECGDPGPECIGNGYACGPSDAYVDACCSGYCGSTGTCQ